MAPSNPTPSSRIRLLSPNVVNKIAAGEVVDRPSSVLKELLENAIDAGARHIEVQLDGGGRKRICVADDGEGMDRDDALLAMERHATSKIRDINDIERINTLGFRGEALAAIASVSRFRLRTATNNEQPGTDISIFGGVMRDVREIGFPRGATFEVSNLFFNVPARRKFLRTAQTELAHCRHVFIVHALAHPDIGFTLHVDAKPMTGLAAGETLEQRLHALFGAALVRMLCPIALSTPTVRLQGFTGIPPESRRDRDHQFFFINGRPAGAPLIGYAVRESYHSLLPRGRHPPVILFIETDPERVDVNVHPQKREVRFRDPSQIRDAIQQAIGEALQSSAHRSGPGTTPVFSIQRKAGPPAQSTPSSQPVTTAPSPSTPELQLNYPARPRIPMAPDTQQPPSDVADITEPETTATVDPSASESSTSAAPWRHARVVGQVGGLFVLLETDDGLVIMDPHAAHERVLFDRYMRRVHAGHPDTQELLMPATVTLTPVDAAVLKPQLEGLRDLGFGIHEFGIDGVMIDAVPVGFEKMAPDEWIATLVADFKREGSGRRLPHGPREEIVARAACRAAVKAQQRLTAAAIEQLVDDLAGTDMPYTCPHGRPILIHLSFADLRHRFGR